MKKLSVRILLPMLAAVVTLMTIAGWLVSRTLELELRRRATKDAAGYVGEALENLRTVDTLSRAAVQTAMKVLVREANTLGPPRINGTRAIGGKTLPALSLGSTGQMDDFALVDLVKSLTGATATLFVRQEDRFVRVSTNVRMPDGSRAVGTELDPAGQASAALHEDRAFYGVVEILDKAYMTGYEPMHDASGTVVGAWYVGYPLFAIANMGEHISRTRILEGGFLALLRANGRVLFRSSQIGDDEVMRHAGGGIAAGWSVVSERFEPWGYTVVAAYPERDVARRVGELRIVIAACVLAVCILVILAQYVLTARLVVRPIASLVERMEQADLNTFLLEDRQDEIGVLAKAFDGFVIRVREVLLEVTTTSEEVVQASEKISAGARLVASSALTQKDHVAKIATVLQEMSQAVHGVSAHCTRTASSARTAANTARDGGTLVENSLSHMRTIAGSVGEASTRVVDLDKRSGQIDRIAALIDEIAGQTSLLALNAAIEAARAGEQGRGFAVVASEVRRLAERTTLATGEIAATVAGIQQEMRAAVECMQIGELEIHAGVDVTAQAGASLRQIVGDAGSVGEMVAQIAHAATQQAAAAEHACANVDQIRRFAGESAEGAERSAAACEQLSSLAARLLGLVARFQLS